MATIVSIILFILQNIKGAESASAPDHPMRAILVSPDYEIVVQGAPVDNLDDEGSGPSRYPADYALVGVISITANKISVCIVNIKVKICITITGHTNFS